MPVHNRFHLVDEAVSSVFNQTHRPIQLIIVDDCSDEPYLPKLSSQPGFEVIIIRHETNQGPGVSRETGRLVSQGDYIAYLDSDDLWHPEKTSKQITLLKTNPQAGMCYCTSIVFSGLPFSGNENIRKNSDQEFDNFLPTIFKGRPWDTSACLWKHSATEQIGPWFSSWTWEDIEYECRAGCQDIKIIGLTEILCYFREDKQWPSLSQTPRTRTYRERIAAMTEMKNSLTHYKKHKVKNIRFAFETMVYRHTTDMFFSDYQTLGLVTLRILFSISVGVRKVVYACLIIAGQLLRSKDMGRLCYRFRSYFL